MTERGELERRFDALKGANLSLDLTRGKPAAEQLDLANELDGYLGGDYAAADGTDVRNYGMLRGLPEARVLGARLLDVAPEEVIAGGNASLTLMFFVLDAAKNTGLTGSAWRDGGSVRCLCPRAGVRPPLRAGSGAGHGTRAGAHDGRRPGHGRGGKRALPAIRTRVASGACRSTRTPPAASIPRTPCGGSPSCRACRPKAAINRSWSSGTTPTPCTTSSFRRPRLAPILALAKAAGTQDSIAMFASTSKITFAGAGVGFVGGSANFLDAVEKRLSILVVGPDKVNQLRHARFLAGDRLQSHMLAHADIVRPKFEAVHRGLEKGLGGRGLGQWTRPRGGYFVSLDTEPGLATEVVALAGELGVALTPAGATFPHGHDPADRNLRIAPTLASLDEVRSGIDVLCLCVRLAAARKADRG